MAPLGVLLAEREGRDLLAGGVLERQYVGVLDLLAARDLPHLELGELQEVLGELRVVGRIVVVRLDRPPLLARRELQLVAELDACDLRDVELREDGLSVELRARGLRAG